MELPLLIMDSALFYRERMGLSRDEALNRCRHLVADVRRFGGTMVINWHDRSLAPERLVGEVRSQGASERSSSRDITVWFATAAGGRGGLVPMASWGRFALHRAEYGGTDKSDCDRPPARQDAAAIGTISIHRAGRAVKFTSRWMRNQLRP